MKLTFVWRRGRKGIGAMWTKGVGHLLGRVQGDAGTQPRVASGSIGGKQPELGIRSEVGFVVRWHS